jgi:hypothetical protein
VIEDRSSPNSPPDEEGTPERSEGGEVIQTETFRYSKSCWCLTSPAALRGGRPLLVGAVAQRTRDDQAMSSVGA